MGIPGIQELYNPILGYLLECRQDTFVSIRKAMQEYFYIYQTSPLMYAGTPIAQTWQNPE